MRSNLFFECIFGCVFTYLNFAPRKKTKKRVSFETKLRRAQVQAQEVLNADRRTNLIQIVL